MVQESDSQHQEHEHNGGQPNSAGEVPEPTWCFLCVQTFQPSGVEFVFLDAMYWSNGLGEACGRDHGVQELSDDGVPPVGTKGLDLIEDVAAEGGGHDVVLGQTRIHYSEERRWTLTSAPAGDDGPTP